LFTAIFGTFYRGFLLTLMMMMMMMMLMLLMLAVAGAQSDPGRDDVMARKASRGVRRLVSVGGHYNDRS